MKVLVVGSGGREHAIVWKVAQSPLVNKVYCAPGNGGISLIADCVPIKVEDIEKIVKFSVEKKMDLVVVAPDNPLAAGMVDALQAAGIRAFGPTQRAAEIESSKVFAKSLMRKYGIPTPGFEVFEDYRSALEYLKNQQYPVVIKADGLALGKGVIIAENFQQAEKALDSIMKDKIFGSAGDRVIIEEYITGQEVSILAFTDGKTILPMVSSQDHKRVFNNDQGLNTGGMGTFSPSRIYTPELAQQCMKEIFAPTVKAMEKEGRKFKGVLFFGLMVTKNGPKVLEYNARFGDPESQVVLPRLKSDVVEIFNAIIDEKLEKVNIEWNEKAAVCVIMASGGYPQKYKTGYEIRGIKDAEKDKRITVFHSSTKYMDGKFYTAGGRVLGVTAVDDTLDLAIKNAYEAVGKINFQDVHYRTDIGKKD
jgi:phosphoribosylamine--glycine ligase